MHFGIIAAGEGSRLASEGASKPKPLIELDGQPMIERLIRIFDRCGAESISVVINDRMPEVRSFLDNLRKSLDIPLNVIVKTTPSSMHTFAELASAMRGKGRFVATTVDTVFREEDFRKYISEFEQSGPEVDGMMAVTDYIDDEKPLYVAVSNDFDILAFLDTPDLGCEYVSGGIYGLDGTAVEILDDCMAQGVSRMRNFQRALVASGLNLKAFPMGKIIDVDHMGDIPKAEQILHDDAKY
ncbi:MAG: NTP transferase domain-containing protein [Muribaculum sp.]|nr:NTP transferase domain-containing protein [Muribaculum sp.]